MDKEPQEEGKGLVEITFKPEEPGSRLRPAETRLLLAYIGEILQEVEIEEKRIIEEERKAAREVTARGVKGEDKSCK